MSGLTPTSSAPAHSEAALWLGAAERPEVATALHGLHDRVSAEVAERRPRCDVSGRCCRFESYGHRLYVTGLEAAWFVRALSASREAGAVVRRHDADGITAAVATGRCPFLIDGLCAVHSIRPLACRLFYCDPATSEWQRDLYERCHREVAAVHDRCGVPYRYGEWRAILSEIAVETGPIAWSRETCDAPGIATRLVQVRIQ